MDYLFEGVIGLKERLFQFLKARGPFCFAKTQDSPLKRYFSAIILFLILVAAAGWAYYAFGRADLRPVMAGKVYRSGQLDSAGLEQAIKTFGIKTIINLRGENEGAAWYEAEKRLAEAYQISLYDFSFDASTLPDVFPVMALVDCLEGAPTPLLVHCRQGIDRTGFVSALILALKEDVPYEAAMQQISWRFGVIPGRKSAGPLFFGQYESWLRESGLGHTSSRLRFWIHRHYLDHRGSIEYCVDTIEDQPLTRRHAGEDRSLVLPSGLSSMTINGWAYDRRSQKRIDRLTVGLNNALFARAEFIHSRPDVAGHLNLAGEDRQGPPYLGWSARFDGLTLAPGAYPVTLHFTSPAGQPVTVATGCVIRIR